MFLCQCTQYLIAKIVLEFRVTGFVEKSIAVAKQRLNHRP